VRNIQREEAERKRYWKETEGKRQRRETEDQIYWRRDTGGDTEEKREGDRERRDRERGDRERGTERGEK
jgi:hypothetical protein